MAHGINGRSTFHCQLLFENERAICEGVFIFVFSPHKIILNFINLQSSVTKKKRKKKKSFVIKEIVIAQMQTYVN